VGGVSGNQKGRTSPTTVVPRKRKKAHKGLELDQPETDNKSGGES